MMKLRFGIILAVLLGMVSFVSIAQDDPAPTQVEIEAEDGLMVIADFWVTDVEDDAPAILLLHMLGGNRRAWGDFIPPLLDSGYHVLNMDMRGHGETGGSRDWDAAEIDLQLMFDWLKAQDGVGEVAVIGGSIGSNMALISCGNDPDCVTAIALSPGLDYAGVQPAESVEVGLAERSALLVGSLNDGRVADSIYTMAQAAPGEIGIRIYPGRSHGTNMFRDLDESFMMMLIAWLDEHTA